MENPIKIRMTGGTPMTQETTIYGLCTKQLVEFLDFTQLYKRTTPRDLPFQVESLLGWQCRGSKPRFRNRLDHRLDFKILTPKSQGLSCWSFINVPMSTSSSQWFNCPAPVCIVRGHHPWPSHRGAPDVR